MSTRGLEMKHHRRFERFEGEARKRGPKRPQGPKRAQALRGWGLRWVGALAAGLCLLVSTPVWSQNYDILHQDLEPDRTGITVIHVWGSHYQMGFALGEALPQDIEGGVEEMKSMAGAYYTNLRSFASNTFWLPAEVEEEIQGMVDGVKSVRPDADLDATDIKIINTYGDWGYACRSHSCWGSFVQAPFKTLSTRRLDFSAPFTAAEHHVLCAWDPDDGSVRWVNFSPPGYVAVITGVNAYGTVVSLHDFNSSFQPAVGIMPRCAATRMVLTGMDTTLPIEDHLSWAEGQLAAVSVATGTFINYYVPEGAAGVFTCPAGDACGAARIPQQTFFSGEVILTTNSQTDGETAPSDDSFMEDYYLEGGVKDMESHYSLMGHTGLHLLTVGFRGQEDMLLWAEGRTSSGVTDRVEVEWSELFASSTGDPDAGVGDGGIEDDGGVASDAAQEVDASAGDPSSGDGGGCSCRTAPTSPSRQSPALWLLLVVLVVGGARFRRRT